MQRVHRILIIHGGQDKQVGIHQAYVLEDALKQRGTQFDTFYQLAEGHTSTSSNEIGNSTYIQLDEGNRRASK